MISRTSFSIALLEKTALLLGILACMLFNFSSAQIESELRPPTPKATPLPQIPYQTISERGSEPHNFLAPLGLALDSKNTLFVVDAGRIQVLVFNPEGRYLYSWGKRGTADGTFSSPSDIAINQFNDVYVADVTTGRFQIFDLLGRIRSSFSKKGASPGEVGYPQCIAISSQGELYVSDIQFHRIQVFDNNESEDKRHYYSNYKIKLCC